MIKSSKVKYEDGPVKGLIYPSLLFLLVGMIVGVFIALNGYMYPDYFSGEYIHFGRMRPVHVGGVTLLWLLPVDLGLIYYFVQRLCGVPLWSRRMGLWSVGLWWFTLILGVFSFPFGTNWGWEYAELPMWISFIPVKVLFLVPWVLFVINIFMTIARRRHKQMYVSLWYVMGTLIWTTLTVWIGWFSLYFLPGGIARVNASFFYVHNLVGLIFTPMGLAIAYYFLPKLANTPIYSHRLSMIGFWTIAFTYAWTGAHHMIHGPISQWLQTVSIVFSISLFIPVWTVVTNLFATLQPQWSKYVQSVPIRFIVMGNLFYLLTCIQGPLMALRNINELTSKTDWVTGHAHMALYLTFSFFAFAGVYFVVPIITQKPLWSKRMAHWHFSLNLIGAAPFVIALWIGGFLQGTMWADWAQGTSYIELQQRLSDFPFLETVAQMRPWWVLRTLGGILVTVANFFFVVNIFNTAILPPRMAEASKAG